MTNEYIKYNNSSTQILQKYSALKALKQDHEIILHSQNKWQKSAPIDLKLIYRWFFENGITFNLHNTNKTENYITYNIILTFNTRKQTMDLLQNLPFGKLLITKIESDKHLTKVDASLSFSNILPPQILNIKNEEKDMTLELNGVIKSQNNWQICINNTWFNPQDTLPNNIKIINVHDDCIKFQWKSFNNTTNHTLKLYEKITLKPHYDF